MTWILIICMFSSAGSGMTSIRVSSQASCENVAKQLPYAFGRNFVYKCVEDK